MMDFFSRLDKYIKFKGLNDNKITVETGISNGLIGKARKSGGSISQENISKILYVYNDLSADWLMTGEGEMLKGDVKSNCTTEATTPIEVLKFISLLEKKDEQMDRLITLLERQTQPCAGYGFKKPTPILCEEITKYAKK